MVDAGGDNVSTYVNITYGLLSMFSIGFLGQPEIFLDARAVRLGDTVWCKVWRRWQLFNNTNFEL